MKKNIFVLSLVLFLAILGNRGQAKEVMLKVFGDEKELVPEISPKISPKISKEQLLTLNGFRQAVTAGLMESTLAPDIFWSKIELKKLTPIQEFNFLSPFFSNVNLVISEKGNDKGKLEAKMEGELKAELNLEQLKNAYLELTKDEVAISAMKLKTFYFMADIDIDSSMTWNDLGVLKSESIRKSIIESWQKNFEKELKEFGEIVFLEKELAPKSEFLNPQSLVLKWSSTFKKTSDNPESHLSSYELKAHYILQNMKSGEVLRSFDYPIQKKEIDTRDKEILSSVMASFVFNLLYSETRKIKGLILSLKNLKTSNEVEVKILSKSSLLEIYQFNSFLQEKFKELKLTSQLKSYSSEGAILLLKTEAALPLLFEKLSLNGGGGVVNDQTLFVFNPVDKSFIITKQEKR